MSTTFDPTKHLRQLRGKGGTAEYLDVKWRLVWLRSEHPDATTAIEHIEISPDIAIFRATVTIPEGGSATDYGSETPKDFGDFIEKAATKALGRALAQLGYGTQFVGEELDEGERIVDSPVDRPQPTRAPARLAAPPAPRPAAAPTVAAGPPPQEDAEYPPPNDAQLLELIRDDTLGPDERWNALWDFFDRAETVANLTARETAVLTSGMPGRDIKAAYRQKHNNLGAELAPPASIAG